MISQLKRQFGSLSSPEKSAVRQRPPKIGQIPRHAAFELDVDHPTLMSEECDKKISPKLDSTATICPNGHHGFSDYDEEDFDSETKKVFCGKNVFNNNNNNNNMISSFVSVIEDTKMLSLSEEKERSPQHKPLEPHSPLVTVQPNGLPFPTKCSSQLRRLLQSQSTGGWSVKSEGDASFDGMNRSRMSSSMTSSQDDSRRRIYPHLPYSPYASPTSSPRVRRKPLRETNRVDSVVHDHDGEYVQLNQYKLERAIGQGSYGIVKLAYNKEDDSHYAMKILSKKKLKRKGGIFARGMPHRKSSTGKAGARDDPLQKVYREIAIMKKLDHPNVVKLVEVLNDQDADNLYMVFELLERGEVLEVPTETPLEEKEAWLAFRDVILGLEYLHYQKIIHRDLKPSNLLRADSGEVKIADLGVSDEFNGHDAFLTNTAGTPAFTPPESLAHKPGDEPYSGKAADIWSLGVTLYSLVYGHVPFHDDNVLSLYNKIRIQPLTFPETKDVSPELKDLISLMLIKDPSKRITLPEIKFHDWVTGYGLYPLPTEEENCKLVEVTETDVRNSVHSMPKLDTLILVKSMIKNHSFTNPFRDKFQKNGRSNSAPETYDCIHTERKIDPNLPAVCEERTE